MNVNYLDDQTNGAIRRKVTVNTYLYIVLHHLQLIVLGNTRVTHYTPQYHIAF